MNIFRKIRNTSLLLATIASVTAVQADVFVSNVDGGSVSIIDPETDTVKSSITVGTEPRNSGTNASGTIVYVPNRHSDSVSVISNTGNIITTVTDTSFNEPYAIAVTANGQEAWVANKMGGNTSSGSITIINTATNAVTGVINDTCIDSPESIATNPAQARAYVINRGDGTVCVFDTSTRSSVTTVTVGGEPRYAVVTPAGDYVYVARSSGNNVAKINTATNTTSSVTVPGTPRNMAISPSGGKVYVATQNNSIAIITTATDTVSTLTFTGASSTYAVALVPGMTKGYVTDDRRDAVYAFDVVTETELTGPNLPVTGGFNTPRSIVAATTYVPSPIPTLSSYTLLILMFMLVVSAYWFRRRLF